jgi:ubiquinone/menaquinone biosynthesis C-methylase UbiE
VSARLLEELVELPGRDVLDVGCGEGALARRLTAAGARVVGLDPLAEALEKARAQSGDASSPSYVQGVAEALPFPAESFDVVIFFNSLHHVPPQAIVAALAEAARVLRPDGMLYVQEPLARGSAFELLRPVNDETAVRAAALGALDDAAEGLFVRLDSREITSWIRHADFATLRARVVSVDPERAERFDARQEELRAAFERTGRPVAGGGYEFEQAFRIELLRRPRP